MYTDFEDFNAYVYHSSRVIVYDVVIWCLGPYVDDSRPYGVERRCLARVMRSVARWWFRVR